MKANALTYGFYDWLEDLIYELKEVDPKLSAEIDCREQVSEEKVIAKFKLRESSEID